MFTKKCFFVCLRVHLCVCLYSTVSVCTDAICVCPLTHSSLCLCAYCIYLSVSVCVSVVSHSFWCHCYRRHHHLSVVRSLLLSVPTHHLMFPVHHQSAAAVAALICLMWVAHQSCFVSDYAMFCCTSYCDSLPVQHLHQTHHLVAPPLTHSQYYVLLPYNNSFDITGYQRSHSVVVVSYLVWAHRRADHPVGLGLSTLIDKNPFLVCLSLSNLPLKALILDASTCVLVQSIPTPYFCVWEKVLSYISHTSHFLQL